MALNFEKQDNKFRVGTQGFSTAWLPDTPGNRKVVIVMLRYLEDGNGKPVFKMKELCAILESEKRQAANQHIEDFRNCGEDFLNLLTRQKKVDERVVAAIGTGLHADPLANLESLANQANEQLGRQDITVANVTAALEQISCQELRMIFKKRLAQGQAHYQEEYVLARLFDMALAQAETSAPQPTLATALREQLQSTVPMNSALQPESSVDANTQELMHGPTTSEQLAAIWNGPLVWKIWTLLLYLHGVSTAAIGGWLGVHKSTICRWLDNVAQWESFCLKDKRIASSGKVAVDEKYVKIGGVFWYLFAAVDCITGCPLHVALYPSNRGVYCHLFLLELKRLGYRPTVIITDGWDAYIQAIATVFPHAEHLYCRFHALQSLFRRLRNAKIFSAPVFKLVCKLLKSLYKRTAERRLDTLKNLLTKLDASHVLGGILAKWPKLIKTVGSTRLPSTANAVERFFGAFDRLYRLKGPFCDAESAQKHLQLFMLGYFLTIGQQGQACPLEKAGIDVGQIPLYHLLNRPNVITLKDRMAEQYGKKSA